MSSQLGLQRTMRFGPHTMLSRDQESATVPYFLAGRKMYHVGMVSGDIQPIGAEHLVGEMGGMWAHPVKVADGLTATFTDEHGQQPLAHSIEVIELLSHIEWRYRVGGLETKRRDFVAEDQAAFVSLITLRNTSSRVRRGQLHLSIWLKFLGCWFGGMSTGGGEYWLDESVVLGYDRLWQGRWGVACGTEQVPLECRIEERPVGRVATLVYPYELAAGASSTFEFVLAADNQRGHDGARHLFHTVLGSGERLLQEKIDRYSYNIFTGVGLRTPDPLIDRSFALAKANLQLLTADYEPHLPAYFLAGVPEYPQLFGCDNEYTIAGAVAAGFGDVAKSTLLALVEYASRACGRVPHEVTTNGRVFNPGNTQETPQLVIACWDYFCWTGDITFLRRVYPVCREGVMEYMPAVWGAVPSSIYPTGDAMVERPGMGPFKLDSVCYLYDAYSKLGEMARVLNHPEHLAVFEERRQAIAERFDHDWWIPGETMFADSLTHDLHQQLDGHWTVVVPLQLGLGDEAHRHASFARLKRDWLNEWGLMHTRGADERVWTLPTGLAALAAFRYGEPELGLQLLQNIAVTASYGMLGAFKELIPIGLCFVQLWSAGLYVQGLLEGALGLVPRAHQHMLTIRPCLPGHWPQARINLLRVGDHTLNVEIGMERLMVNHLSGSVPLTIRFCVRSNAVLHVQDNLQASIEEHDRERWVVLTLDATNAATISVLPEHIEVQAHQ